MAQSGRASVLGIEGRWFKSNYPDHSIGGNVVKYILLWWSKKKEGWEEKQLRKPVVPNAENGMNTRPLGSYRYSG
jgi:hypothetical protein